MDFGLKDLPQSKWGSGTGRQVILKGDFGKTQAAILQLFMAAPAIEWVDATEVKVPATADCPAQAMLKGFPNILHPDLWVGGGLTDGRYRENVVDAILDFDLAASLWGTEKSSQWYAVYALAGNSDVGFTIKGMPWMRVCSQAGQVISLGTLETPATGRRYGFSTDELVGGMIYFISGPSMGLMRTISANNNASGADGTSGTINYSGDSLTLAAGNWFIVLPPATNFMWLGDIFNNSSGDIDRFVQRGKQVVWLNEHNLTAPSPSETEDIRCGSPLAVAIGVSGYTGSSIGYPIGDGNNVIEMGNYFYLEGWVEDSRKTFAESPVLNCRYQGTGGTGAPIKGHYFKYA